MARIIYWGIYSFMDIYLFVYLLIYQLINLLVYVCMCSHMHMRRQREEAG